MLLLSAEPTLPKGPDIILRCAREKRAFNALLDIKGTDQPARKCRLICALNVCKYGVSNLIIFLGPNSNPCLNTQYRLDKVTDQGVNCQK